MTRSGNRARGGGLSTYNIQREVFAGRQKMTESLFADSVKFTANKSDDAGGSFATGGRDGRIEKTEKVWNGLLHWIKGGDQN